MVLKRQQELPFLKLNKTDGTSAMICWRKFVQSIKTTRQLGILEKKTKKLTKTIEQTWKMVKAIFISTMRELMTIDMMIPVRENHPSSLSSNKMFSLIRQISIQERKKNNMSQLISLQSREPGDKVTEVWTCNLNEPKRS